MIIIIGTAPDSARRVATHITVELQGFEDGEPRPTRVRTAVGVPFGRDRPAGRTGQDTTSNHDSPRAHPVELRRGWPTTGMRSLSRSLRGSATPCASSAT